MINNLDLRNVAAKTASYTILTSDANTVFTNTGAAGPIFFGLPKAATGLRFTFANTQGKSISIYNLFGDTIYGGRILENYTKGSVLTLLAVNSSTWIIEFQQNWVKVDKGYAVANGAIGLEAGTGAAWAWGNRNNEGELGNNSTTNVSSPVSVLGGRTFTNAVQTTLFSLALEAGTGAVWAWGQGTGGKLGNNSTANASSPVLVAGGKTFVAIAAEGGVSLALEAGTGAVWAWGYGTNGTLGNNSTANASSPVVVVGGKTFTAIAGSSQSSLALEAGTGAVWAWGRNSYGQLGNNSNVNTSSPVSVVGGKTFVAIAASSGNRTCLALEAGTGAVWAWGYSPDGELGNNSTAYTSSPVSVVGGKTFVAVTTAGKTSFALEAGTGAVWAWGYGIQGQLGNNLNVNVSSPVSVVGGKVFISCAGGNYNVSAIEAGTGVVWTWGNGTLGNNSTANASSPVSIARTSTLQDYYRIQKTIR